MLCRSSLRNFVSFSILAAMSAGTSFRSCAAKSKNNARCSSVGFNNLSIANWRSGGGGLTLPPNIS